VIQPAAADGVQEAKVPGNPADISVLEGDDLVCGRSLKIVQAVA
jgi:hypothetical protein